MKHRLALVGFGTVAQGLCEILKEKRSDLRQRYDYDFDVVAVSDIRFGTVYDPKGLHINELLEHVEDEGKFTGHAVEWNAEEMIRKSNATTICELAFTDLKTGEPATSHCRAAFETGKNVVTSNKGPAALAYREMKELAHRSGVRFLIEGTVMSGTPVLNLVQGPLAGCSVSAARGILNGTTNYILTQMETEMSYEEALRRAQELGYAEADPTGDVEGYDAGAKAVILANVVMGEALSIEDVSCKGITEITAADIETARSQDARWKLIAAVAKKDGQVVASVAPEMVPLTHPLAAITGAANGITFSTDLMGDVTVVGAGAGRRETGFSILSDLLRIHRGT